MTGYRWSSQSRPFIRSGDLAERADLVIERRCYLGGRPTGPAHKTFEWLGQAAPAPRIGPGSCTQRNRSARPGAFNSVKGQRQDDPTKRATF